MIELSWYKQHTIHITSAGAINKYKYYLITQLQTEPENLNRWTPTVTGEISSLTGHDFIPTSVSHVYHWLDSLWNLPRGILSRVSSSIRLYPELVKWVETTWNCAAVVFEILAREICSAAPNDLVVRGCCPRWKSPVLIQYNALPCDFLNLLLQTANSQSTWHKDACWNS